MASTTSEVPVRIEELVKLVRQPDWLLGREIDTQIGLCLIVAVNPEKNEVTIAKDRRTRVKLSIDIVEEFFLHDALVNWFEPKEIH